MARISVTRKCSFVAQVWVFLFLDGTMAKKDTNEDTVLSYEVGWGGGVQDSGMPHSMVRKEQRAENNEEGHNGDDNGAGDVAQHDAEDYDDHDENQDEDNQDEGENQEDADDNESVLALRSHGNISGEALTGTGLTRRWPENCNGGTLQITGGRRRRNDRRRRNCCNICPEPGLHDIPWSKCDTGRRRRGGSGGCCTYAQPTTAGFPWRCKCHWLHHLRHGHSIFGWVNCGPYADYKSSPCTRKDCFEYNRCEWHPLSDGSGGKTVWGECSDGGTEAQWSYGDISQRRRRRMSGFDMSKVDWNGHKHGGLEAVVIAAR